MQVSTHDVTGLLQAWVGGDQTVRQQLSDLIYSDLKRRARLVNDRRQPLNSRTLVHESLQHLINLNRIHRRGQTAFCALAARIVRRILIENAKSRPYQKRVAGARPFMMKDAAVLSGESTPELIAIDDALKRLLELDSFKSEVVELRYFGGLTIDEVAAGLGLPVITVRHEWNIAKAWLEHEMMRNGTKSFIKPLHSLRSIGLDSTPGLESVFSRIARRGF